MKLLYTILIILTLPFASLQAQSFGIGTDNPDPNAIMELNSTSLGFLMTRLTTAQRNTNLTGLTAAQQGLLIYNTDDDEFNYWDGAQWIAFPGGLDDDWYEANTTTAPNNIADNVYTNGFVGIGLNNPSQSLHIASTSAAIQSILVQDLAAGGNAYNPTLATVARNNRASVIVDKTNGLMYAVDADDIFWRLDGNAGITSAGYTSGCPNLISTSMNASSYDFIGTRDNTDFIFATNDIERMRILRDGQMVFYGKGIGVPASSPTGCIPAYPTIDVASFYATGFIYPLNAYSEDAPAIYGASESTQPTGFSGAIGVQGSVSAGEGIGVEGFNGAANAYSIGVLGTEVSNAGWAVYANGSTFSSLGYYIPSDERLKTNIKTYNSSLSNLMKLDPVSYDFKEEYDAYTFPEGNQIGFLAQNIKEVFPNLVKQANIKAPSLSKDSQEERLPHLTNVYTVNYEGLIPVVIGAVQEQQKQIEALQLTSQTTIPNTIPNHQFGTIVLDANGKSNIAIAKNFTEKFGQYSYQLTSIGSPNNVYVSREIQKGEFEISGQPNAKVSWVIYGE